MAAIEQYTNLLFYCGAAGGCTSCRTSQNFAAIGALLYNQYPGPNVNYFRRLSMLTPSIKWVIHLTLSVAERDDKNILQFQLMSN